MACQVLLSQRGALPTTATHPLPQVIRTASKPDD